MLNFVKCLLTKEKEGTHAVLYQPIYWVHFFADKKNFPKGKQREKEGKISPFGEITIKNECLYL